MTDDLFKRMPGEIPYRNPKRIPHMVNLMLAAWATPGNEDMRMGQLLMNAARLGGWGADNIWNCEDEVFAKGFLAMLEINDSG